MRFKRRRKACGGYEEKEIEDKEKGERCEGGGKGSRRRVERRIWSKFVRGEGE